jgi:hypothetical protein
VSVLFCSLFALCSLLFALWRCTETGYRNMTISHDVVQRNSQYHGWE